MTPKNVDAIRRQGRTTDLACTASPGARTEHVAGIPLALSQGRPAPAVTFPVLTRCCVDTFGQGGARLSHVHGQQHPGLTMARDFAGEDDSPLISRLDCVSHRGRSTKVDSAGQAVAAVGWGDVNIVEAFPPKHKGIPNIGRNGRQSLGTGKDPVDGDLLWWGTFGRITKDGGRGWNGGRPIRRPFRRTGIGATRWAGRGGKTGDHTGTAGSSAPTEHEGGIPLALFLGRPGPAVSVPVLTRRCRSGIGGGIGGGTIRRTSWARRGGDHTCTAGSRAPTEHEGGIPLALFLGCPGPAVFVSVHTGRYRSGIGGGIGGGLIRSWTGGGAASWVGRGGSTGDGGSIGGRFGPRGGSRRFPGRGPAALVRWSLPVVPGHQISHDIDPSHGTEIGVRQIVAVHHLPLAKVCRPEPEGAPSPRVDPGDGVVELPLLVHVSAAAGGYDLDMIQMLVEGVFHCVKDGPLVYLAVRDGVEGPLGVPLLAVDGVGGNDHVPCIFAGNGGLPQALQGGGKVGLPLGQGNFLGGRFRVDHNKANMPVVVPDGKVSQLGAPDRVVHPGGGRHPVPDAFGLRDRGGPYAVVSDLPDVAPVDPEVCAEAQRIHHRDSKAEPPVPLDRLQEVLAAVLPDPVHDHAPVREPGKYLEQALVLGPRGDVGIDPGIVLNDEHPERTPADLNLGPPVMVGMIPVRASRMVPVQVPDVVQALAAPDGAGDVVRVCRSQDVEAVRVEVGRVIFAGGGGVAEGEPVPVPGLEADGGTVEELAGSPVEGEAVAEIVESPAEVQGSAVVHVVVAVAVVTAVVRPLEEARRVVMVDPLDPGRDRGELRGGGGGKKKERCRQGCRQGGRGRRPGEEEGGPSTRAHSSVL